MVDFKKNKYSFPSSYSNQYSSTLNPYHSNKDGFFTSIPCYSPTQNERPSYTNNLENKVQYQGNFHQPSHLSLYANPRSYMGYRPSYDNRPGYGQNRLPSYN